MKLSAIYLAAGQSRRMGKPKLPLELAPRVSLGSLGLRALSASRIVAEIFVVVRPDDDLRWMPEALPASSAPVRVVPCPEAPLGMSWSIRSGLAAARAGQPDAILIALADQPFVSPVMIDALALRLESEPTPDYVASRPAGGPLMPPAVFRRTMFDALERLEGDAGARKLFASGDYRGAVVDWSDPWHLVDVDDAESLQAAASRIL